MVGHRGRWRAEILLLRSMMVVHERCVRAHGMMHISDCGWWPVKWHSAMMVAVLRGVGGVIAVMIAACWRVAGPWLSVEHGRRGMVVEWVRRWRILMVGVHGWVVE